MYVRLLKIPDGAIRITDRSEAPEGATIYEGEQGGLAYLPVGEGTGEEESKTDREQQVAEIAANAEPNELAGGVAAAISDDREDFHDIRNAVVDAETAELAQLRLELELDEFEIDKLAEEVALQEEMRQEFDVADSLDEIKFGQEVLADRDRPMRGVVDDVTEDTVWIRDANRDITAGVSLDDVTLFTEPTEGESDVKTAEPGKYGMASNDEVLSDPFDYATEVKGSRDAGIESGNTTGDSMKILEMDDGSRVFATPLDAYEVATTGVVDGPIEARINNLNSPKVINRLGGEACKTERTFGPGGREYIAKEGIDGQELRDARGQGGFTTEQKLSAQKTMAAAYFVGNGDLHAANVMVTDDEFVVIDHDSAGGYSLNGNHNIDDIDRFASMLDNPFDQDNREMIFDNARDIKNNEVDLSGIGEDHKFFADLAADKALRVAAMDDDYDLPEDEYPEEMQLLDGFEDTDNWPEKGDSVLYVDDNGDVVENTIHSRHKDDILTINPPRIGLMTTLDRDSVNRIVEVL